MSTSADGSVNGKKLGRNRTPVSAPKSRRRKWTRTPFRSAPVDGARHDDAEWRLRRAHVPDLHRRRVCAEQEIRTIGEKQRVLRVARGMVRPEVQRREVVVVVLDLRSLGHLEPHADEHVDDLVLDEAERMRMAARTAAAGKRDVDPVVREALGQPRGREPLAGDRHRRLDGLFRLVDERAERRPLRGRDATEAADSLRQRPLPAEVPDTDRFELRLGPAGGDLRERRLAEPCKLLLQLYGAAGAPT